jgi:monoterpene epsilon-lactone hydrolase
MKCIGTIFLTRPTWTTRFTSVIKAIKLGSITVPKDVHSIRFLLDHDIPTWLPIMPSGVKHKLYEPVPGEWIYKKRDDDNPFDEHDIRLTRCIFYIHGGAFCCGHSGTHRELLYRLVKTTGSTIFSVNYRRPPEYPFPIPINDCIEAYMHVLNLIGDPKKIIFAGDSAGGNLVVSVLSTIARYGLPMPEKAILLSPWVDLTDIGRHESWKTNTRYDFITKTLAKMFALSYCQNGDENELKNLSPTYYDNLGSLPELLVEYGEYEVLHDQIKEFCEKVRNSGGKVIENIRPDMVHVFPMYHFTGIKQSGDFFNSVNDFCSDV